MLCERESEREIPSVRRSFRTDSIEREMVKGHQGQTIFHNAVRVKGQREMLRQNETATERSHLFL